MFAYCQWLTAGALVLTLILPPLARAQEVQGIAAIVNDQVVSGFDIEQRLDLVIASAEFDSSPQARNRLRPQILRALVDESLQVQEAERNNITINDQEMQQAFVQIAQQNNVPIEALPDVLQSKGISMAALQVQMRAELLWGKLIRRQLLSKVTVTDEEVDEIVARLEATAGQAEIRLQEIFVPIDSINQEQAMLQDARRLVAQLRQGADFAAAARQFSRAATARLGGDMGWMRPGQLSSEIEGVIENLSIGEVADPILVPGGLTIYRLAQRRTILGGNAGDGDVSLKQMMFIAANNSEQGLSDARRQAEAASAALQGCEELEARASTQGLGEVLDLGTLPLKDLPPNIQQAVLDTDVGQFSTIITAGDAAMILMPCSKDEPEPLSIDRAKITDELTRNKLNALAYRYLRDLRLAAVVDVR